MSHMSFADPALTIALALAAGIIAQSLARHLRIPGIVLLLGTGVLLGPDVADVVRPETLGSTLQTIVGFAVAVILFEGGMNLKWRRLRREARSIRQLVTIGALVTALGGALCARFVLDWDWTPAVLFGTLVIVTGPTVVTPLLRRIRVNHKLATVLEAEGVLVDAIGAIVAVIALEIVISPPGRSLTFFGAEFLLRLGFGGLVGLVGGLVVVFALRFGLPSEGLENVFTLAWVLALFQLSNGLVTESGIVTVVVAGLAVGNLKTPVLTDLREFKEQLTVLLIGLLFVLLAADVRVDAVRALGRNGIWAVLVLMLIVRPLNVAVGTYGSDLTLREKLFLSWLAPRGIVAAAVASLFAQTLGREGLAGGDELRAMVFLVIATTVLVQGLSGGVVAWMLGVRRPSNTGYAILGANEIGRAIARILREVNQDVVLLDSNPDLCRKAEEEGLRVLFGTGLSESILQRAELDGRIGALAVTPNDELNLLFVRRAREIFKVPRLWVLLRYGHVSVTEKMVKDAGALVLFGQPRNIDLWALRLERKLSSVERWRRVNRDQLTNEELRELRGELQSAMLPLAIHRARRVLFVDTEMSLRKQDVLHVVVFAERRDEAVAWLERTGWEPVPDDDGSAPRVPGTSLAGEITEKLGAAAHIT